MSEWNECKLGEICCDVSYGYTESASLYPIGPKFLRITDIVPGRVNWETVPYCKISSENRLKYQLQEGDIVIARTGATTGYTYTIKSGDIKHDSVFASYLIRYRVDTKKADPFFIGHSLTSTVWQGFVEGILGGSAQPGANAKQFADFEISLPPLPEQQAIGGVLSSLDDKIDLLHWQNKTLEGMAEALWWKMFVEEADPGWDEKGLDEIATFLNGLPCQKYPPDTSAGPLPVIKIKELRTGITDDSDLATSKAPPDYIIDDGDILFSWSGSIEVVIWSFGKGVLNQHLFKVTSVDYPKWFCYYWIKHHLAEFRDIAQDKATTMGHIQRHHLSAAKVLIPDEKSFEYLNKQIDPLFEKMVHNLKAIRKFARLRDTLLPKLMSGEVRVKL